MTQRAHDGVHVALRGISKRFGGIAAVRDVDLEIERGTIHALVGENGAGKSTVSKMIAGVIEPTAGELIVDGRSVSYGSPRHALADGIAMMEQELAMLPHRTVIENVYLGFEPRSVGFVRRRQMRRDFDELLQRTGFELDGSAIVGTLRLADQQKVEILRAVARDARLIIMDEPTAPLSMVEAEQLHTVIRDLRDNGTTIVYISHFLDEVLALADVVTVMRDGRHVVTSRAADETEESLVRSMLGRSLDSVFPERRVPLSAPEGPPALEVRGLTAASRFRDISFEIRSGEIVGLAGLVGSGRTEVARAIFGADSIESGQVLIDGQVVRSLSPRRSISRGVMMLPESRQAEGLVMSQSIADNVVMSGISRVSRAGFVNGRRRAAAARQKFEELDIRAAGPDAAVSSLSGGNQQKVVFAKCLYTAPGVLIVDEPTRGVDIGAKRAIYELLVDLAAQGMAVLVISSELEEVLGLAHRVLVLRRGRIAAELTAEEATQERVLAAAFGAAAA